MPGYVYKPWSEEGFDARRLAGRRGPHEPLAFAAVAVVLGIAVDRYLGIGSWAGALSVLGLVAWVVAWRRGACRLSTTLLLATVGLTSATWHHCQWRLFGERDLGRLATLDAAPVCLEAIATDAPQRRPAPAPSPFRAIPEGAKSVLTVRVLGVRSGADWRSAEGQTELVVDGPALPVRAGDRLRVFGQLRASSPPRNPGQFDFAAVDRSDRQLATVRCESPACVTIVQAGGGLSPWRWITGARLAIERQLWRRLTPEQAPLAAAMLVGARQGVARDRAEPYRLTGTLHLLVVSGLHVGLVVGMFYVAARLGFSPRRRTLVVMMVAIALYALVTGARPPVVRAAVLAEMICLAAMTGRRVLAINSLAAAGVIVLAWSPAELFRSGPQLSFIAAATLMWLAAWELDRRPRDPMSRLLASVRTWPERFADRGVRFAAMTLLATLIVWGVTAPLLMTRFHLLSPVAVPISLAVFPLMAVAVVGSLLLVSVGWLIPPLAGPLAWGCGASIDGLEAVVTAASGAPGGVFWLAGPAGWWSVGAYAVLAAGLLWRGTERAAKWFLMVGLAWIAAGFLTAALPPAGDGAVRCTFIDVGHGCAVLVKTPPGPTLLYDAGSLGSPGMAAETIAGVLWEKGIRRIDALVLSHADVDHFNAAPGLLERFEIGGVYVSPFMFRADDSYHSAAAVLARRLEQHGVPVQTMGQGDRLELGGVTAEVLHPTPADAGRPDNANSLVLAVEHGGRRVLLPGDLEAAGLEEVVFQATYDCDLLLAPHHGSDRSDPPGFAGWSTPEWVVVSGGHARHSTQAGVTYAAAGARVLRTSERGAIEFSLSRNAVEVRCFLSPDLPNQNMR